MSQRGERGKAYLVLGTCRSKKGKAVSSSWKGTVYENGDAGAYLRIQEGKKGKAICSILLRGRGYSRLS